MDWPKTVDEAVGQIFSRLSIEDLRFVKKSYAGQALEDFWTTTHFTRWIRNTFGLWQNNEELLSDAIGMADELHVELTQPGAGQAPIKHPDDASAVIAVVFLAQFQERMKSKDKENQLDENLQKHAKDFEAVLFSGK